ncbi:MAG: NAD(+)/NADH kinase [Chloroflexi bacterium]|nr:NAD(+)/NADH kinase [Chloroflexota bacterium]
MEPRVVGIVYNQRLREALPLARRLAGYLESNSCQPWLGAAREIDQYREQAASSAMIISLGGDGTLLRVARLAAPVGALIVGVNLGQLGFLTEAGPEDVLAKLPRFLAGEHWVEERLLLQVAPGKWMERQLGGPPVGPGEPLLALNDVVVSRGTLTRAMRIETKVDGDHLTTYVADGVIVATPTGSTAYSLAVGGPILQPALKSLLLTPIAPHLAIVRSLVLPPTCTIQMQVFADQNASLSIDGQVDFALHHRDVVEVSASSHVARFARLQPRSYFARTITEKLGTHILREVT